MAKWGEGDARWAVTDLGEAGRNVNGWHWVEVEAMPWARGRAAELLGGAQLAEGVAAGGEVKLEGEAVVNQRKGKLIPAYEFALELSWKGAAADGTPVTGTVKVPYISEENHDEVPEVLVAAKESGAAAEALRARVVAEGRPRVREAVATLVRELRAGGPAAGAAPPRAEGAAAALGPAAPPPPIPAPVPPPPPAKAKAEDAGANEGGTATIEITEKFFASAADIFSCFTDAGKMAAYTRAPAEADARPGGRLAMFAGSVEGTFVAVDAPRRLEMHWRFTSWANDVTSRVVVEVEEPERGAVTLRLRQTGVPREDRFGNGEVAAMTERGWRERVLGPIRKVFGYGA
jgi:activator of HSP90 ATPase